MKKSIAVAAVGALLAIPSYAVAQPSANPGVTPPAQKAGEMKGMDMKGMDMKSMETKGMHKGADADKDKSGATAHRITGTVKDVDAASKSVTLDHGPVKTLNWPAMSMKFKVDDKVAIDRLKPGTKVDVDVVQRGKEYVVTSVK